MSLYQLNKLMRDLTRSRDLIKQCQAEPHAVLKDYDLSAAERDAVANWQLRKLYDLGANPLLLLVSSMAMGHNMRDYVAALKPKKEQG